MGLGHRFNLVDQYEQLRYLWWVSVVGAELNGGGFWVGDRSRGN